MTRLYKYSAENSTDVAGSGSYTVVTLCPYRGKLESFYFLFYI
jgi:hypothetical protein